MAKGQNYSAYQKKIINNYYEHLDTITLTKLGEAVSDLYLCESAYQAEKIWDNVVKTLGKTGVEPQRVARLRQDRNVEALAKLVSELSASTGPVVPKKSPPAAPPASTPSPVPTSRDNLGPLDSGGVRASSAAPGSSSTPGLAAGFSPGTAQQELRPPAPTVITPDILKSALKAFRKRLKLTRLDEESALGHSRNPLTGGSHSEIVAIQPPTQFPRAVWEELVKQGKLKESGRGFYQLVDPPD